MIKLRTLLSELDEPHIEPIHVLGKGQRSPEERERNWLIDINKKIATYIKNRYKGDLNLRGVPLKKLPVVLKRVGGSLWLQFSKIEELPDGLYVNNCLDLRGTPIKKLPSGLYVGDDLFLSNTRESLHLTNTKIEELPENLYVGKRLYLFNTPVAKKYTPEQIRAMVPNVKGAIII